MAQKAGYAPKEVPLGDAPLLPPYHTCIFVGREERSGSRRSVVATAQKAEYAPKEVPLGDASLLPPYHTCIPPFRVPLRLSFSLRPLRLCFFQPTTNAITQRSQRKLRGAKKGVDIGCRLPTADWHFFQHRRRDASRRKCAKGGIHPERSPLGMRFAPPARKFSRAFSSGRISARRHTVRGDWRH